MRTILRGNGSLLHKEKRRARALTRAGTVTITTLSSASSKAKTLLQAAGSKPSSFVQFPVENRNSLACLPGEHETGTLLLVFETLQLFPFRGSAVQSSLLAPLFIWNSTQAPMMHAHKTVQHYAHTHSPVCEAQHPCIGYNF